MKRVDVLKGIEKILVEKAYEIGHISHRADGDWQKVNNGWVRVKGSPAQPAPDTDDSAERAEYERQLTEEQNQRAEDDPTGYGYEEPPSSGKYGEITEEDFIETEDFSPEEYEEDAPDGEDDWDRYDDITDMIQNTDWESIVAEYDNPSVDQIMSDYDFPDDERIRDEISTYIHTDDSDEDYGDDEVDYTYAKDIDYSQYDDDIKSIEFRENDNGELEPHDDDYFRVADKIYEQTDREDMSDEEADQLYDGIVDRVIDRAYELRNGVQKSAVRDMRSAPTTKNMGF